MEMIQRRVVIGAICLFSIAIVQASSPAPQKPAAAKPAGAVEYKAMVDQYCVTCHSDRLRMASLSLEGIDLANVPKHGDVLEKMLQKVRSGEMPPAGRPRPDQAAYQEFGNWLETSLDSYGAANPNPGRPMVHRLNRTEYANAVHDLLSLDIDGPSLLPPDDSTRGFDNIADVLGVSPLLLESYVNAARKISRLAVGDPQQPPATETYRAANDGTQDYHLEGMPFGTRGGLRIVNNFPLDGEYEIKVQLTRNVLERVRGLEEGVDLEVSIDGTRLQLFHIDGGLKWYETNSYQGPTLSTSADKDLHLRVPVKAGPHVVVATFPVRTSALPEGQKKIMLRSFPANGFSDTIGFPYVDRMIIQGPYAAGSAENTPSRRRIFACRPATAADEPSCARQILSSLARRGYRGTMTDPDLDALMKFYEIGRKNGTFEQGIETGLWRMLASPQFIFRAEFDPKDAAPGAVYRVSDVELASRLSFFLWSTIPDDQLLAAAKDGSLHTPAGLERQVKRMLASPRSHALAENFGDQWLNLRALQRIVPTPGYFPNYDDNLRQGLRQETEYFLDNLIHEDRSVLELLTADYTFVNERVAKHYGIPGVSGDYFRRVHIADENRRGLLGMGSVLIVTSYANRTSPVQRGKWVLENILNTPPPAPPPNVPDLKDNGVNGRVLTMRERMAEHRANPVCASCHARMDPIGFALENFDATGAWRTKDDDGSKVDASGALPDGTKFEGPGGLRSLLMAHPDRFIAAMSDKLLTYALGRSLGWSDEATLRKITRDAAKTNYKFSSMVMEIVKSVPFQMRQAGQQNVAAASGVEQRQASR
jgi:mono/diheme cytochrome c family protein